MSGGLIELRTHMRPTAALHSLHSERLRTAAGVAAELPRERLGRGKLELRITEAPRDPLIPRQLRWAWALFEVFGDEYELAQNCLRQGLKATDSEAYREGMQALRAAKVERA